MTLREPCSNRYVLSSLGVLFALSTWSVVAWLEIVSPFYLPPPWTIVGVLLRGSFLTTCGWHLVLTIARALAGYMIAILIAIPLGLAIGRSARVRHFTSPIIEFLRPLPSSAVIPIALLFLGLGWEMNIAIVAFGSVWPILVSTIEGARAVDPLLCDTAALLRFSLWDKILRLYLPSSAPFVAAGLRTSLAVALILSVTVEMIAGSDGIGFLILDFERAFRTREMYAAVLVLGAAGYVLNALFLRLQKKLIFW